MRKNYTFTHKQCVWFVLSTLMTEAMLLDEAEKYLSDSRIFGKSNMAMPTSYGPWKRTRIKRSLVHVSAIQEMPFLSCNDTDLNEKNTSRYTPSCEEIHNAANLSSSYNITDPDLLRIFRHELLFCKDKRICDLHRHNSDGQQQCCYYPDKCSCADDCKLRGNCCFGSVDSFEELVRVNYGKSCYASQLFLNNINEARHMVNMVDTCTDRFPNLEILDKCIKQSDRFDQDPFLFIPVYSKRDKFIVFKNKYCAFCNSQREDELVYWKIVVSCEKQKRHFEFKTLTKLFQFVRDDPLHCNMFYGPPDGYKNLSPCQKADVETCPDTSTADAFYSKACRAYTSIYAPYTEKSNDSLTYKNVFCYLCNGHRLQDSPNKCEINPTIPIHPGITVGTLPFIILLDFNSLLSTSQEPASSICSGSQRYDKVLNACRNLFCTNHLILRNETCTSPLEVESRRSYSIRYQLYNRTVLPYEDTPDQSLLNYHRNRILYEVLMLFKDIKMQDNICRAALSNVYRTSVSSNKTRQTEYIAIDFDVEIFNVHNFSDITKRLISLSGKIINMTSENGTVLYEIRVSNSSIDSSSFMSPPSSKIPSNLVDRSEIIIDKIQYTYEKDTSSPRCEVVPVRYFSITQFALCPKVSIQDSSMKILKDGSVCIENRGCYHINRFQMIDDKLILCAEDYFRNIENTEAFRTYSEIQSILSIVCTSLSVFCLLLTLVTYLIFPSLRSLPGRNNMALISTLMCAQILYQFGIDRTENSIVCEIFGILIHFTWLASICWMNVCTYHMFHTFVWDMMRPSMNDNLKMKKYLLFYAIYSFILPIIFVSANVITSLVNSGFKSHGYGPHICYISSSYLIGFTFALPVGILLIINLILFLVVIYKIQKAPKMKAMNHHSRKNFLVFIKLSCITGLFWLIGFLYQWLKFEALGYVFIVLNASQGVFIMFAFICNKRIVGLYKDRFAEKDISKTSKSSHETKFTNIAGSH